jgi:hypothetical protein
VRMAYFNSEFILHLCSKYLNLFKTFSFMYNFSFQGVAMLCTEGVLTNSTIAVFRVNVCGREREPLFRSGSER